MDADLTPTKSLAKTSLLLLLLSLCVLSVLLLLTNIITEISSIVYHKQLPLMEF
jgi:hypothetical protein